MARDDAILDYFRRAFFLFVPNVCNARCEFCYVHPAATQRAHLAGMMPRVRWLLESMHSLGFEEVRFTGGEPLVFDDFGDLVATCRDIGISYSLLTNGIQLSDHLAELLSTPPNRVTVSIHDLDDEGGTFGVPRSQAAIFRSMRELTDSGVRVAVTIVYPQAGLAEAARIVDAAVDAGIHDVKIIYENSSRVGRSAVQDFEGLVHRIELRPVRVRASDLNEWRCDLRQRGYLSVSVPSLEVWDCCVRVPSPANARISAFDVEGLHNVVQDMFARRSRVQGPPCVTYHGACPVSLKFSKGVAGVEAHESRLGQ